MWGTPPFGGPSTNVSAAHRAGLASGEVRDGCKVRDVSRILTVLSAQVAPVPWDPPATLDKFEDHVRVARRAFPDVDLMIFPELYLTAVDGFTSGGTGDWERRVAERDAPRI